MNLLIRVKLNVIPSGALMNYYGHISTSETKPRIFFLKSAVVHCRVENDSESNEQNCDKVSLWGKVGVESKK